jgi:hypothetical protein
VLRKLHTETFVLNLRNALVDLPPLPGYRVLRTDESTLEVEVNKEQNLNGIFAALSGAGIEFVSMRNKPTGSRSCSCASWRDVTSPAARPKPAGAPV